MSLIRPLTLLGGLVFVAAAPTQDTSSAAAATETIERMGTFVPAQFAEAKLKLAAYQGGLEFTEVVAHGSPVRAGDVLARFDLAAIDEQIVAAERDLRSTEIRHANAREQARIEGEVADERRKGADEGLANAERGLEQYEKHDLVLKQKGQELNEAAMKDGLDDQKDELAQLEKMYTADELTDATEEIVLKRSRRQLARSEQSVALQLERRKVDDEYGEPQAAKARHDAVEDARRGKDRTARQLAMEQRAREDGLTRLDPELSAARERLEKLRRDREQLTVRAPCDGIALHGAADDYRPGRAPARHEIGGGAGGRQTLFTVMKGSTCAVALDLPESLVFRVENGAAATVTPIADGAIKLVGRTHFDRFPDPRSAGAPENSYVASIELDATPAALVPGMRCKVTIAAKKSGS